MKGAIESANWVSTVSPTYAKEILDPWFAHKLDPILRERAWKLSGILNGIDVVGYDPATDKNLYETYDAKHLEGKAVNKAKLQERLGLAVDPDVPLIGMVTRLVSHKGLDLVKGGVDNIMTYSNAQFVVLGSGTGSMSSSLKRCRRSIRADLCCARALCRSLRARSTAAPIFS